MKHQFHDFHSQNRSRIRQYVDETSSAKQIAAVKISTSFLNLTKTNLRPAVLRLGVLPDDPRPGGPSAGGQKTAGRATTGGLALVAASQVGTNWRLSGGGDQPGEDDRDDPGDFFFGGYNQDIMGSSRSW